MLTTNERFVNSDRGGVFLIAKITEKKPAAGRLGPHCELFTQAIEIP